jgi:hypothetical protein
MISETRLPDFLIIGAMKCGTTSLFRWLGAQPEVRLPEVKEPHFFSRDDRWDRGLDWYRSLFEKAGADTLKGEASASSTDPRVSPVAAERMARIVPAARLIFLVRDPVERLRSHYRHEVQRSRERRPLVEALKDPENPYLRSSLYHLALAPYLDRFPREQILVARLEDLTAGSAWDEVLTHLGLPHRPRPQESHNVSREKAGFTRPMLRLWESGLGRRLGRAPKPMRALGKRFLLRRSSRYAEKLEGSLVPIPEGLLQPLWLDGRRFAERLGRSEPLWDRSDYGRSA